jgi:diaminopimelate epimerase
MAVTFHKMHGLGNDFVVLDLREQDFNINPATASGLANRHTGIGCDQVLVLRKPASNHQLASFEIWNADGSVAEQCGNGVRCLALYLKMRAETPPGEFFMGSPVGEVRIECLDDGQVEVDMGKPEFAAQQVPIMLDPVEGWYRLKIDQQTYKLGAASMGNPHALVLVDDIETADVARLGAAIGSNPVFPKGCNVGFAQIIDREHVRLRVYERGAAETRACGSGACAAMAILHNAGLVENRIKVTQTGGILVINWTKGDKSVIMRGHATHVFEGNLA